MLIKFLDGTSREIADLRGADLYSAECVDENIRCNEYDFDENGKRI